MIRYYEEESYFHDKTYIKLLEYYYNIDEWVHMYEWMDRNIYVCGRGNITPRTTWLYLI